MNTYIPTALIQVLSTALVSEHPSRDPIPELSRGIRLLDKNEALIDGYLYVGSPADLKRILSKYDIPSAPLCIVTAGVCTFFSEEYLKPTNIFLIETNMDLIPLYNKVHDCYHRTSNQKPKKAGDVFVNEAFQNLMMELLNEKMTLPDDINAYIKKNGITTSKYFRLYAMKFNSTTNKGSIAWNYIISFIQQIIPASYIATFNGTIIILDKHVHANNDFSFIKTPLLPILEQYDGYFGIGNICGHVESIPAVYSQIISGITYGVQINPQDRIYYYEDYAMFGIIDLVFQASTMTMHTRNPVHLMNNESVKIIEYDNQYNDNLIYVLDCFLRHNCNLKNTSDALFIHRNTLRNKIEKIEEIMGRPLGDPTFEERLRFSCSAYRYITLILKENPLKLRRNSENSK